MRPVGLLSRNLMWIAGPTGLQRDMFVFDEVVERGGTIQTPQS